MDEDVMEFGSVELVRRVSAGPSATGGERERESGRTEAKPPSRLTDYYFPPQMPKRRKGYFQPARLLQLDSLLFPVKGRTNSGPCPSLF